MTMSFDQRLDLSHLAIARKRPLQFFLDFSPSHFKQYYWAVRGRLPLRDKDGALYSKRPGYGAASLGWRG